MERVPILFTLWMRDDDPIAEDVSDASPVADFFENAKLKAAVGSESAQRFERQVARIQPATGAAKAAPDGDWNEEVSRPLVKSATSPYAAFLSGKMRKLGKSAMECLADWKEQFPDARLEVIRELETVARDLDRE